MTLAWTYQDGGGELTPHILWSYLPSKALELSQSCGLVSKSDAHFMIISSEQSDLVPTAIPDGFLEPGEAAIGFWYVRKEFRDQFFQILERPIAELTAFAAADKALRTHPTTIHWKEPTPRQHIDTFLSKRTWWSKVWLVKQISGIQHKLDQATDKFLKRLYKPPTQPSKRGYGARNLARLEKLRQIMAKEYPEKFAQYKTVAHLIWTPE
jgi:hypothetical protein